MDISAYPSRILNFLIYMATLKLTIFKAKVLKDGRHKIRVAVCHKRETCYIVTNFIIDNEAQFKNGQVVKRPDAAFINRKLRGLLDKYQESLDRVKNQDIYTCRQLKELVVNYSVSGEEATFQSVCENYISELNEEGRNSYATLLERNNRYFTEFTKGEILLSDITPVLINNYARFLKVKKGIGRTTTGMMMSRTRTIINKGIKSRLVKYEEHPFLNYSISSSPIRELDIDIDTLNKIRLAKPKEKRLRVAQDLFLLSFYLGGINLIDLLSIDFQKDKIEYVRTKSRNTTQGLRTISFSIPKEAKEISIKWMDKKTGRLDFGYKYSYPNFSRYLSRSLDKLVKSLGITEKVIFYSARKSFAQYASEIGIPDGVIDYCLGHSDKSKGVIRYYTKVKQQQANIAISRVIDYVNNPDKYKDFIEMRKDIMMMRV